MFVQLPLTLRGAAGCGTEGLIFAQRKGCSSDSCFLLSPQSGILYLIHTERAGTQLQQCQPAETTSHTFLPLYQLTKLSLEAEKSLQTHWPRIITELSRVQIYDFCPPIYLLIHRQIKAISHSLNVPKPIFNQPKSRPVAWTER